MSFSLQTSLISPNFPARQPPIGGNKFFSFFVRRLPYREVFGIWREVRWGCRVRLRTRLLSGARRGVYAFCKCRLIPPHQSLARQTACSFLPPKGKASAGSASYIKSASNFIFCKINSPEHIFPKKQIQMRTLRTRAFPFEGEGGAAGDG